MILSSIQGWSKFLAGFLLAYFLGLSCQAAAESPIYSYTKENGLKVITNIPPPGSIHLTVTDTTDQSTVVFSKLISKARKAEETADRIAAGSDQRAAGRAGGGAAVAPGVPATIDSHIVKYANHYNVQPDLVRALVKAESNFNPRAVSPKGARGLMQLMPETAWRYGVRNIFDPEENIAGGVSYLSDLLQMFSGNIPLALSAYNAGENLVARIQRIPNYPETRTYVARISRMFDFQRSPYATVAEEPLQPRVRLIRREDGTVEITNLE